MQNLALGAGNVKRYCECWHCMEKSVCYATVQDLHLHLPGAEHEEKRSLLVLAFENNRSFVRRCSGFRFKATLHCLCWDAKDTAIWLQAKYIK
ncbi:uncharacterized [Tachysurus ichikawai]